MHLPFLHADWCSQCSDSEFCRGKTCSRSFANRYFHQCCVTFTNWKKIYASYLSSCYNRLWQINSSDPCIYFIIIRFYIAQKLKLLISIGSSSIIIPPLTVIIEQMARDCEYYGISYVDLSKVRKEISFFQVKKLHKF